MRLYVYASLAILGSLAVVPTAQAVTVHWGNALNSTLVKSDTTPISAGDSLRYEVGVFAAGFTPTAANPSEWAANWKRLDSASYNATASYFSSSFDLVPSSSGATTATSTSPETVSYQVPSGTKVYLMVYNNTAMDETTELFLGTNPTWITAPPSDTQLDKPLNLRLSGITQPIFGGANSVPSGGIKTPPVSAYALQTATFIPEPSASLLAGIFLCFGLLRRRCR